MKVQRTTRSQGLTLVETLVTLLLVALAFGLLNRLFRVQNVVLAHQEQAERFLVDADQYFRLVGLHMATAFQVSPTSGETLMTIHHFSDSRLFTQGPLFSGLPFALPDAALDEPGVSVRARTDYRLAGDHLWQDLSLGEPLAAGPSTLALTGLNTAICEVDGPRVEIRLSFFGPTKVDILRRVFYAPGVAF